MADDNLSISVAGFGLYLTNLRKGATLGRTGLSDFNIVMEDAFRSMVNNLRTGVIMSVEIVPSVGQQYCFSSSIEK